MSLQSPTTFSNNVISQLFHYILTKENCKIECMFENKQDWTGLDLFVLVYRGQSVDFQSFKVQSFWQEPEIAFSNNFENGQAFPQSFCFPIFSQMKSTADCFNGILRNQDLLLWQHTSHKIFRILNVFTYEKKKLVKLHYIFRYLEYGHSHSLFAPEMRAIKLYLPHHLKELALGNIFIVIPGFQYMASV